MVYLVGKDLVVLDEVGSVYIFDFEMFEIIGVFFIDL